MRTDMQACLEGAQDVEAAHNARRMLQTSGAAAASLRLMSCAIVVTGVAASNASLGHHAPSTCQDVREVACLSGCESQCWARCGALWLRSHNWRDCAALCRMAESAHLLLMAAQQERRVLCGLCKHRWQRRQRV